MNRELQPATSLFAVGMIAEGVLAVVTGDFALQWQPVVPWVPGRMALAYASGVLMVALGAGLLFRGTAKWAARILLPYLGLWWLLKVPELVAKPGVEISWEGAGEIGVLLAGGWMLFARMGAAREDGALGWLAGERGARAAMVVLGLWLLPIGLSHFFYAKETHDLVPAWLPFRWGWGYLTGAGHIAAGVGVLTGVWGRVAAWCEAGMVMVFTVVIWVPAAVAKPTDRLTWEELCISWAIGAACWAVAQGLGCENPGPGLA